MKGMPGRSPWLLVSGALLVAVSLAFSNGALEAAFGRAPHSLSWGPALFRALLGLHGLALVVMSFRREGSRHPAPLALPDRKTWIALGLLAAIATALRIPSLNSCLWLDEVLTMAR